MEDEIWGMEILWKWSHRNQKGKWMNVKMIKYDEQRKVMTMNGKKREQKYENCQTGDGKQIYTKKKSRMEMKRNNNDKGYQ